MRLTKRQLKIIIREEYSRLRRRGLIKENADLKSQVDQIVQEDIEGYGPEVSEPFYDSLARAQSKSHFEAMCKYDEELADTFTDFDHACNMAGIESYNALGYVREKYAIPSAIAQSKKYKASNPRAVLFEPGNRYSGNL